MRWLALFLVLTPSIAFASPCTVESFYDGFSGQFFGPYAINGFIYGLDETYLYVTLATGDVDGFINVPLSVAQSFNYTKNPDKFYAQNIAGRYGQPLMTETCDNLLTEDGNYLLE